MIRMQNSSLVMPSTPAVVPPATPPDGSSAGRMKNKKKKGKNQAYGSGGGSSFTGTCGGGGGGGNTPAQPVLPLACRSQSVNRPRAGLAHELAGPRSRRPWAAPRYWASAGLYRPRLPPAHCCFQRGCSSCQRRLSIRLLGSDGIVSRSE
ncbi:hypothetical protein C2845_PM16G20950 [Panicum miliaceum]|uniref:Uncharacterized protein n=1 Tax=Panicum miliaceum TaxID=4540 RepID=A0A3L6PZM3_PANMI|nr:hypothetical protein C2845_PM16G20950 [Panicum miliaceum]